MDTGRGRFAMLEDAENHPSKKAALERAHPNHGEWFHEGQTVQIGKSIFKIKKVKPTELVLKLVRRVKPEDDKHVPVETLQALAAAVAEKENELAEAMRE